MRVVNDTEGRVIGLPIKDVGGRELLAVVLKYTFALDSDGTATIVPAEESPPIDLIDTYNGDDPALASIRRPSQLCEFKPGTEVLLLGSAAVPPNDATSTEVGLVVGSIKKTVRVFGLRTWRMGSFGGVAPGPALPIREPVPLIYELSWGGRDLRDPARPLGEPRNYSGRGINRSPRELVGQPATRLELPTGANDPASFGAIHRHWQPRASWAGTYDSAWEAERMPLLPRDFDPMFHVAAPPDQWSPTPLRSDEPLRVVGVAERPWVVQLPRIHPGFFSTVDGVRSERRSHLDCVLIDTEARTVELFWRVAVPLPKKYERLQRVTVRTKHLVA